VIDVHLHGSFYVARAAAPHFKTQQSGAYVHMTSNSGLIGNLGQANYAAAKLGVAALSRAIAAKNHYPAVDVLESVSRVMIDIVNGEQRNSGIEFTTFGEPIEGVRLLGGFMLLDAVLTKTAGGQQDGWTAAGAPAFRLNLGGEWDTPFVRGLTLTGRAVYTGAQYIDATTYPRRTMPEWTRFDVGARYAFVNPGAPGKVLVARFNVENVLDNNYWAGGSGATLLNLGAPRTFRLAMTADF